MTCVTLTNGRLETDQQPISVQVHRSHNMATDWPGNAAVQMAQSWQGAPLPCNGAISTLFVCLFVSLTIRIKEKCGGRNKQRSPPPPLFSIEILFEMMMDLTYVSDTVADICHPSCKASRHYQNWSVCTHFSGKLIGNLMKTVSWFSSY